MALPLGSFAGSITTLFNTGVSSTGAVLADGSIDANYTNPGNTVFVAPAYATWIDPGPSAKYVAPDTNQGRDFGDVAGVYTLDYLTTFDLTGFDPATVSIVGRWSTDNTGNDILVNGHSTGNTNNSFISFTGFSLSGSSGFFTSGINTLDFNWSNTGMPGGLLVIFDSATANSPEPASMILIGAGLTALALIGRRKRSRA
jgi:hypothetical protein